ncbi:MAG: aminoglycoside phosphotransferase family protein [Desulfobacterales bacterium]|nr:aminoglycoside phosphotransferase family protein [Desulfobacterales bacterium]
MRFIYMYLVSQKFVSHTSAQAIRIKNNVRSYYVNASPPFSTKILISKTRTVKDMKNEIHIRSQVESFDTVKVPKILQCHMEYDPPFFCEEIISGRKLDLLRDTAIISQKLCPQLWYTYERFGIKLRKIQDAIDLTNVSEIFHDACNVVGWHNTWCDRSTFLSRTFSLLESNLFLPFSIGHGDLSLGNMIIGQDREIYIVDWECAKEMPIVFDLFSILKNIPQSRQYFESKIEDLISENKDIPILPFREQCFLSILVRILQWKRSPEYLRIIGARQKGLQKKLFKYFDYANGFI